jgi:hypothetical protein
MQPNGVERYIYENLLINGVAIMPWVPYNVMPFLINMSKKVLITANEVGGCQRLVLEAKACDVPVEVDSDSPKLTELKDLTREEVLKDWNEEVYADKLYEGITKCLQAERQ